MTLRAILFVGSLSICGCGTGVEGPRNVVLISIDTLRPDVLGVYGGDPELSPNLDSLGAEGWVFEDAVAQAPWTWPSHASLMTSRDPFELDLGTYDAPLALPEGVPTLAEHLRAEGFDTAAITGGGYLSEPLAFDRGFDFFFGDFACREMSITVSSATHWLKQRTSSAPFFLFLHTWEVHQYDPKSRDRERFVRPYAGPLTRPDELAPYLQGGANRDEIRSLGEEDWRYARDVYRASVASVDRQLARFLRDLEKLDLLDDTLIVVLSDHGEELGEHGGSGHGYTLFDENLRVPLLMRHRSLEPRRVAGQAPLLDVAPTIVELLGLEPPSTWRGRSLRSLVDGPEGERTVFAGAAHRPLFAVRTDARKTIFTESGGGEVFDLATDPMERTPLDDSSALSADRALLGARIEEALRAAAQLFTRSGDASPESSDPALAGELERLGYVGTAEDEPQPLEVWRERIGGG